jgi:hypothetical protein
MATELMISLMLYGLLIIGVPVAVWCGQTPADRRENPSRPRRWTRRKYRSYLGSGSSNTSVRKST